MCVFLVCQFHMCIVLYCIVLYCILLYFIVFYCILLYSTVFICIIGCAICVYIQVVKYMNWMCNTYMHKKWNIMWTMLIIRCGSTVLWRIHSACGVVYLARSSGWRYMLPTLLLCSSPPDTAPISVHSSASLHWERHIAHSTVYAYHIWHSTQTKYYTHTYMLFTLVYCLLWWCLNKVTCKNSA